LKNYGTFYKTDAVKASLEGSALLKDQELTKNELHLNAVLASDIFITMSGVAFVISPYVVGRFFLCLKIVAKSVTDNRLHGRVKETGTP